MSLTKKDLQEIGKLVADTVTVLNDVLRKELKGDMSNLRAEMKEDMSNLRAEMKEDMSNLRAEMKEDIYKFKDEILGEIQDFRDDMTVTKGYGDKIENHEERISVLERPVAN